MNQPDTAKVPQAQAARADSDSPREASHSDFVATRPDEGLAPAVDWWPESADGQCSETAALFATSQSAPLNVV